MRGKRIKFLPPSQVLNFTLVWIVKKFESAQHDSLIPRKGLSPLLREGNLRSWFGPTGYRSMKGTMVAMIPVKSTTIINRL